MSGSWLDVIVGQLPRIIAEIKAQRPSGEPEPTDAEVIAALRRACDDTLAKDDDILRTHPAEG